jgi:hypothetical protein
MHSCPICRIFTENAYKKVRDNSPINYRNQAHLLTRSMVRRRGYQVFCLLIGYRTAHYFIHRFGHDQPLSGGKRDKCIRSGFNVFDQLGIENKRLAAESGKFDHGNNLLQPMTA